MRNVNAPRERVWRAWTEEESLGQWWGPKGFDIVSVKLDLRPGGTFHYLLRSPDGLEMWGKFIFREILPQERLVFVVSFSDAEGRLILADAISYASNYSPELIIDIATLTGSAAMTFGNKAIAIMGNADRKYFDMLRQSGEEVYERIVGDLPPHIEHYRMFLSHSKR
jgi:uncharacterized protein YndB with AHSA1/START domain